MAQTYIKTLTDKDGNTIAPRTRVEAITLSDGTTNLEDQLLTLEEGMIANPLTINADYLNGSTFAAVTESIVPSANITYDLGSPTNRWKDIYLSSNSIHLGDTKLSTETGSLVVANAATGDPIPVDASTLAGHNAAYFTNYADTAVSNLVAAAPSSLNTLKELADALGSDANYASTVTTSLSTKAPINNPTFTGTVSGVSKAMVGLGSVDNTADLDKPISTATQTALNNKANKSTTTTATLLAASWVGSSAPYTYTLTVSGVTTTSIQELLPTIDTTSAQINGLLAANIQDAGQSANTINLKAFGTKPGIDLPIRIILRGDA